MAVASLGPAVDDAAVAEQVEIGVKYSGYLDRQRDEIERQQRHESTTIPADSTMPACAASRRGHAEAAARATADGGAGTAHPRDDTGRHFPAAGASDPQRRERVA
jgi:hypothetical protein